MRPKVYLAGPVTGTTHQERSEWRMRAAQALEPDIETISPLRRTMELNTMFKVRPHFAARWINQRCWHDVKRSDALFVNFMTTHNDKAKRSIGTIMELAWAFPLDKFVVVAIDQNGIYDHEMVRDCATLIVYTFDDAIFYLRDFLLEGAS